MNKPNHIRMMMAFICIIASISHAQQPTQSFFDTVESIKKNLYKVSAEELCTILAISYQPVPIITADQLKQEMSTNSSLVVVNVLTKNYYDDCHIIGSINITLRDLVDQTKSWERSQRIVVYCALDECDAGDKACILLNCMGFTDVVDYRGGIKEWFQLQYPTEGPALSEYLHMKSLPADQEYDLYPKTIVCSRQTRWIHRYQK